MSHVPPPLVDNDDDLFDKDNENEDLFSSAIDVSKLIIYYHLNHFLS